MGNKSNELQIHLYRKRKKIEEWEFDRIDDQKDQEFVECEINNFQIIRFSQIDES